MQITRPAPLVKQSKRFTILVVDDTKDFVDFLDLLLSHNGFNVRRAYSGQQCLEILSNVSVDLVVLDVMMPKMDGLEVCRELKRIAPSLPVILLTAKDDLATRAAAMTLGVSEFLAKPVNIEDFLTRVRTQVSICEWEKSIESAFSTIAKESNSAAGKA